MMPSYDSISEAMFYEAIPASEAMYHPVVVVTRHQAVLDWLVARGFPVYGWKQITVKDSQDNPRLSDERVPNWKIISHVTDPAQVAGKIVIGALPLHLAALAVAVGSIEMPGLRADQRGKELSLAEMWEAGAMIRWYRVAEIDQPPLR